MSGRDGAGNGGDRPDTRDDRPDTDTRDDRRNAHDGGTFRERFGPLLVPMFLQNLLMSYDACAMNVAISAIVKDLGTTLTGVQSAISLYALVIAALTITGSKVGARRGYERAFTAGAIVYALGTATTALAPSLPFMLLGWSLMEGTGVALMVPAVFALITELSTGAVRTTALATLGALAWVGSTALGPLLGGLITTYSSWRLSFAMECVVTTVVVLMMLRPAAATPRRGNAGPRLDIAGSALSAAGFGLLVIGTLMAGRYGLLRSREDFEVLGWTVLHSGDVSPAALLGAAGLAVLLAFAVWERHRVRGGRDPLVRLSVLRVRTVRVGSLAVTMQSVVLGGTLFLVPVFVQTTLGYDAMQSGLTLLPLLPALLVTSTAGSALVARGRLTHKAAISGAFLFMVAGCALIAFTFDADRAGPALAPGLFLVGLGVGLTTTLPDLVQSAAAPAQVGDVVGLSRTGTNLGWSIGIALAGAFMTTALVQSFETGVRDSGVLTTRQKDAVMDTAQRQVQLTAVSDDQVRAGLEAHGMTSATAVDEIVRINAEARRISLSLAIGGMAVLAVAGFGLTLRIPRAHRP